MAALGALGYLTGSQPGTQQRGVTVRDERAWDGYNLFTSAHGPEAFLLDMDGRELHRWHCGIADVWPEFRDSGPQHKYFRRVRLFPNGDLLAVFDYTGLVKLDKDSRVLWSYRGGAHHDVDVAPNGDVYVLGHENRVLPELRDGVTRDNFVAILDPEGRERERIWISECFLGSTYENFLDIIRLVPNPNVFHTNTLTVLDGRHAALAPFFARGNLLVSMRNLGAIAVIEPEQRSFAWTISGPWLMQHEPVLLDNGNMLLFDNRTAIEPDEERSSRVIEFDPLDAALYWEYVGSAEARLYSAVCGAAQRLPNGNTLITESDHGRAFEVTYHEKEIVWEYLNPHRTGEHGEFVAVIPEVIRLPPDFPIGNFVD